LFLGQNPLSYFTNLSEMSGRIFAKLAKLFYKKIYRAELCKPWIRLELEWFIRIWLNGLCTGELPCRGINFRVPPFVYHANRILSRARVCKRLRRPGIDSEDSIPPAYVEWRAGTTNRVIIPTRQARNRFLGSLKGLQIRAQILKHVHRHR
jgi:hypothetical protein